MEVSPGVVSVRERVRAHRSTWLTEAGCTHVAMEATGVYWKPVWHVLEDEESFTLVLANAQHIRNVPGRKSDRNDAAWSGGRSEGRLSQWSRDGRESFSVVLHPAVPDPRIHETGYRVGAWRWPRGRFLYGAKSPFFSWTRSPASTPYCETGDSSGERAL